ncbi:MAG: ABC transporter permease [Solirubrobacteraceae bacterium MAG38_C4-C5]|nr:ABC transporter permease [Candidatus Siliceabacter maunaloa]
MSSVAPPPVAAPQESAVAYGEAAPLVIEASRRVSLGLGELWSYRELLYFLVWRNLKIRYKQAAIGVAWVVLQPVLTATLFTLIFGVLLDAPSGGVPYPVFFLAGLVLWQLFAASLMEAGNSLVSNEQLVTKIYFPRLLLPMAAVFASLVDFAIALVLLAVLAVAYGVVPPIAVVTMPLFVTLTLAAALGAGFWLSALNVRYRDVQAAIPFLTQFLFFATPLVYATTLIPEPWRIFMGLNPMAGAVEGFRWALFGVDLPLLTAVSAVVAVMLFATGLVYFRRTERTFADVV